MDNHKDYMAPPPMRDGYQAAGDRLGAERAYNDLLRSGSGESHLELVRRTESRHGLIFFDGESVRPYRKP